MERDGSYRYLNSADGWSPSPFQDLLDGVVVRDDGSLALGFEASFASPGTVLPTIDALGGPAGIGIDPDGALYVADPAGNRILRWDSCGGDPEPIHCFSGEGTEPGKLSRPRGVLVGPRQALYIADTGNHRIQIVDLATGQIIDIWGRRDPNGEPVAGSDPGALNEPWDLAADQAGFLYVVDHGNHRVQKFDPDGRVVPAFWEQMRGGDPAPVEPTFIAAGSIDDVDRLLLLDRGLGRLLVYQNDGSIDSTLTARWLEVILGEAAGVAASGQVLYIGDGQTGAVLSFDLTGHLTSVTPPGAAPAGLALDSAGRLVVHRGDEVEWLAPATAYRQRGTFAAGPFTVGDGGIETRWRRLQLIDPLLPLETHIQLWTLTTSNTNPVPLPDLTPAVGEEATPIGSWRPAPRDAVDLLMLNAAAPYLWVAATFDGDGSATPVIPQIRVTYEHEGWTRHLPALYTNSPDHPVFFERVLGVLESVFDDLASEIDNLPIRFDPAIAPEDTWLDWLAGWLGFTLDAGLSISQRRRLVSEAFALEGRRGTIDSLRDAIASSTSVNARIVEPGGKWGVWSLGENSILGFTTVLASAEPEPAVVGSTAVLDESLLLELEDAGASLFDPLANRFQVSVFDHELSLGGDIEVRLRAVIEREKPAHTSYDLCVIGPEMRVGVQALVGVDAIVGGPPPELRLGDEVQLGIDSVLADGPPRSRRVGFGLHAGSVL